ncbi:uncharacterized protein LACBIDRAFT_331315 [Laccaria bicolor S238N-H82]|uniref:Predicted protein n=1 Tax=Laccaria bicolor (strain S238N-H82 / ATCC MYA-4686) TaxID=486041 RepID=B0DP40_LACBS|nr:uncharacterized protein LACBIDRAFT_331315 [Laccaria bicolor S238N-H82]EDR03547.1 predicted protein [Laccaria bicolor S238N-H82]|eukprot:XP_001885695.1 predicted protein [Laccaria bicolor S238N-H82]
MAQGRPRQVLGQRETGIILRCVGTSLSTFDASPLFNDGYRHSQIFKSTADSHGKYFLGISFTWFYCDVEGNDAELGETTREYSIQSSPFTSGFTHTVGLNHNVQEYFFNHVAPRNNAKFLADSAQGVLNVIFDVMLKAQCPQPKTSFKLLCNPDECLDCHQISHFIRLDTQRSNITKVEHADTIGTSCVQKKANDRSCGAASSAGRESFSKLTAVEGLVRRAKVRVTNSELERLKMMKLSQYPEHIIIFKEGARITNFFIICQHASVESNKNEDKIHGDLTFTPQKYAGFDKLPLNLLVPLQITASCPKRTFPWAGWPKKTGGGTCEEGNERLTKKGGISIGIMDKLPLLDLQILPHCSIRPKPNASNGCVLARGAFDQRTGAGELSDNIWKGSRTQHPIFGLYTSYDVDSKKISSQSYSHSHWHPCNANRPGAAFALRLFVADSCSGDATTARGGNSLPTSGTQGLMGGIRNASEACKNMSNFVPGKTG